MKRFTSTCAAALALLALAGCATAARERRDYLNKELDAHYYKKPITEVWKQVLVQLAEQGYPLGANDAKLVGQRSMNVVEALVSPARDTHPTSQDGGLYQLLTGANGGKDKGPSALTLETGWSRKGIRYHVEGEEGTEGTQIVFARITQTKDHQDPRERDFEQELTLMRRVDPEAASRIDDAADKIDAPR